MLGLAVVFAPIFLIRKVNGDTGQGRAIEAPAGTMAAESANLRGYANAGHVPEEAAAEDSREAVVSIATSGERALGSSPSIHDRPTEEGSAASLPSPASNKVKPSCAAPCKMLSNGVEMPLLLYGTAWKEDKTEELVSLALQRGFRGIDTANQRRHYNEASVGQALRKAIDEGVVERSEVFVQSKFTFPRGHTPGQEPYSVSSSRSPSSSSSQSGDQARESFASSLRHLQTNYLDSYIIHGPMKHGKTLTNADLGAWRALEALYAQGKTRAIGVSNFGAEQLRTLVKQASIKPHVAQIRTFATSGWDDREASGVRAVCEEYGIVYQAYSLLTANRHTLVEPVVTTLAKDLGDTPAQFAFRFALGEGLVALTGTKNPTHMNQDLDVVRTLNEPGRMLKADGRAAVRDLGKKLLQVSMTKRQRHKRRSRRGGHFR